MYHAIVRRKVLATFDHINGGDWEAMVDGLDAPFRYRFHGEHALGGVRTTRSSMIAWWQRVMRLLPGARFTVHEVLVNGGPARTRIAVRLSVAGAIPGGARYENTLFQFMTIRWGRVSDIESLEDLQVLERALDAVAASGEPEAHGRPIEDDAAEARERA
ncbi:nuclear transport factor 2 family protein [Leucobacter luti]|uniref:nuclear transport factor 2 family protein n=1 Tax=Leucobacter luti TaxID=340320 RepID=UPI003D0444D0